MTDELLIKYISGQCSIEEKAEIQNWLKSDESHDRLFELEQLWGLKAEKQFADKARLDKSYERMSRKLKQDEQKQKKSNVLRLFSKCIKYAAAVTIIGLLTFNLVQITNENKDVPDNIVVVPKGQRVCLTLSDGSTIWLNAGSRFTYPAKFSKKERNVTLDGEGYFEVAKNPDAPFTVNLPALAIKVLGTKFNVTAFDNEPSQISLCEGSVEVSTADGLSSHIMEPNDVVYYTKKGGLVLKKNSIEQSARSWITGDLKFENKTLLEMAKVIERKYNITLKIVDSSLAEEFFTCHFREDLSIDQVLELLKKTQKVNYTKDADTVYLYKNRQH